MNVWRNVGGALSAPATLAAGNQPASVAMADLDGDGAGDLITRAGSGIHGLLRRGGEFTAARYEPLMDASNALSVADLDTDGTADVVSASDDTLVVFRSALGAAKTVPEVYEVPAAATAIADLDGDGRLDVVAAGSMVRVLLQKR